MLHDLGIPIGRFVVAEGGVENPTLSGFLTPGGGIFALQIEGNIGGFGFARFSFLSGGTVLIFPLLLCVFCLAERSMQVKVRKQPFL